jgi:hypothetical protein
VGCRKEVVPDLLRLDQGAVSIRELHESAAPYWCSTSS